MNQCQLLLQICELSARCETAATRCPLAGVKNASCWPNKSQCRWHWCTLDRDSEKGRDRKRVRSGRLGDSTLLFRLTLPAFETRNFTHAHISMTFVNTSTEGVCLEIWHNTAAAAASNSVWYYVTRLHAAHSLSLGSRVSPLAPRVLASYATEIGISRRIFYASNENVMPHGKKTEKVAKSMFDIFQSNFRKYHVYATLLDCLPTCPPDAAVLVNNACKTRPKRHYKYQEMKRK